MVTTFVRSALAAGQPVLVAVPGRNLDLVREEMEYPACVAHEALINEAFAGRDAEILCPYDTTRLAPAVLADAARTHPLMTDGARTWSSDAYGDPLRTAAEAEVSLAAPPASASLMSYDDQQDLVHVRRFVAEKARANGLTEEQTADLIVAINELAANTVEHTADAGRIALWRENGLLVCQVDDGGRLESPLAGYVPPGPRADRGRGLALVNQLCDLVRIQARADGTSIRVQMAVRQADGPARHVT